MFSKQWKHKPGEHFPTRWEVNLRNGAWEGIIPPDKSPGPIWPTRAHRLGWGLICILLFILLRIFLCPSVCSSRLSRGKPQKSQKANPETGNSENPSPTDQPSKHQAPWWRRRKTERHNRRNTERTNGDTKHTNDNTTSNKQKKHRKTEERKNERMNDRQR